MNTIAINRPPVPPREIHVRSYWVEPGTDNTYILSNIGKDYVAMSLTSGASWRGLRKTKEDAVAGLEFLCASADITITPHA